jgi:methylated-DNA-[protein]-cysteine S-methyltransferase
VTRPCPTEIAEQCCVLIVEASAERITLVASPEGVTGVYLGLKLRPQAGAAAARAVAGRAARQLEEYLAGKRRRFDLPLVLEGLTGFQKTILATCQRIPYGRTSTYSRIAQEARAGVSAARAAGGALARNPVPIFIPCHRVLRANGDLGGFGAGVEWKRRLLDLEGAGQPGGRGRQ